MLIAQLGGGGEVVRRAGRVPPAPSVLPDRRGAVPLIFETSVCRLRARQTVAFGFLVFLTGAGGAALRPRPIAFANCEREAA